MSIDAKASANWDRAAHAYNHYVAYIASKPKRLELSFTDLVYLKNFKGGSTVIGEPPGRLSAKLNHLARALVDATASGELSAPLSNLAGTALERAKLRMVSLVE